MAIRLHFLAICRFRRWWLWPQVKLQRMWRHSLRKSEKREIFNVYLWKLQFMSCCGCHSTYLDWMNSHASPVSLMVELCANRLVRSMLLLWASHRRRMWWRISYSSFSLQWVLRVRQNQARIPLDSSATICVQMRISWASRKRCRFSIFVPISNNSDRLHRNFHYDM